MGENRLKSEKLDKPKYSSGPEIRRGRRGGCRMRPTGSIDDPRDQGCPRWAVNNDRTQLPRMAESLTQPGAHLTYLNRKHEHCTPDMPCLFEKVNCLLKKDRKSLTVAGKFQ